MFRVNIACLRCSVAQCKLMVDHAFFKAILKGVGGWMRVTCLLTADCYNSYRFSSNDNCTLRVAPMTAMIGTCTASL